MPFHGGQRDTEGAPAGAPETLAGVQSVDRISAPPPSQRQHGEPAGLSSSPPALGDILAHDAERVGLPPGMGASEGEQMFLQYKG